MALSQLLFHVQKLSGPDIKYIHTCKEQKSLTSCKAINGNPDKLLISAVVENNLTHRSSSEN